MLRPSDVPAGPGVYVLRLADGKGVYVGQSDNMRSRCEQHARRKDNPFVRSRGGVARVEEPLTLRRQQREGWSLLEWEKQETLERVLTEPGGVDDVRGWQFSSLELKYSKLAALKENLLGLGDRCNRCGRVGHFASACPRQPQEPWLRRLEQRMADARAKEDAEAAGARGGGSRASSGGFCIRCRQSTSKLDSKKPLCRECFDVWSQYQNVDYREKYCHACGAKDKTTFARPMCAGCYSMYGDSGDEQTSSEYASDESGDSDSSDDSGFFGFCIRCGQSASELDSEQPFCSECFHVWSQYKNVDYREKYCHACGAKDKTTFARPMCASCYSTALDRRERERDESGDSDSSDDWTKSWPGDDGHGSRSNYSSAKRARTWRFR